MIKYIDIKLMDSTTNKDLLIAELQKKILELEVKFTKMSEVMNSFYKSFAEHVHYTRDNDVAQKLHERYLPEKPEF